MLFVINLGILLWIVDSMIILFVIVFISDIGIFFMLLDELWIDGSKNRLVDLSEFVIMFEGCVFLNMILCLFGWLLVLLWSLGSNMLLLIIV